MVQIQKRKQMSDQVWNKKTLQKTFFTSVLTIDREIPKKIEGKNPGEMCQLIFLKICPQQQKQ